MSQTDTTTSATAAATTTTSGAGAATSGWTAGSATTTQGDGALVGMAKAALEGLKDGKFDSGDALSVAGAGVEALGAKYDAAGAANSAPLGELMQLVVSKIKFLAQPLEKLMGSPEAVARQAGAWDQISTTWAQAGEEHAAGAADLVSWSGTAATNYTQLREVTTQIFPAAALGATAMSNAVKAMGELVAIVRKTIWDIIAQFLGTVVQSALSALAAAVPTFGQSITAFSVWFIGKTVSLAGRFFAMLAKLIAKGREVLKALQDDAKKLDEAARAMRQLVNSLGQGGSAGKPRTAPVPA